MAETKKVIIDVEVKTQGANVGLDGVKKGVDDTTERVKKLKTETDKTSKSMSQGFKAGADAAAIIPGPIGQAASAMTGLTGGIGKVVAAFTTLRGAIIATGIGALVIVVGSLIAYFTQTERGAQKLRVAMAAMGAVVGSVSDAFIGLVDAAQMFIKGDFKGGIDKVKDSFKGLGDEIERDVKAAIELENASNALKIATRDLSIETANQRARIKELNLIAEDTTKSYKERGDAAREAAAIESGLMTKRTELAEENLRIQRAQAELNETDEDTLQKIAEAEIAVAAIKMESLEMQTTLQNKLNTIEQQQVSERQSIRNAELVAIKKRNDAEIELAKKLAEEKAAIAESEFKTAEKRAANEQLIDEYIAERKAVTAEEQLALDIERAQKAEELKHAAVVAAINQNQADLQLRIQELAEAEDLYLRERMLVKGEIETEYYAKKLAEATKNADDIAAAEKAAAEKSLAATQKINAARISAATNVAGALGGIGRLMQQQGEENTAAAKTLAVAEIAISTAVSIAGAIKTATQASATPWDMIAGIAAGIAAVVAGIASATAILDTADVPGPSAAGIASGAGAGATAAPSFSPVTTNTTQLGNTQQAELAPVQAYVVETQITGSQANINQIESQSTFGGG